VYLTLLPKLSDVDCMKDCMHVCSTYITMTSDLPSTPAGADVPHPEHCYIAPMGHA
jgi:hypothetical protein